MEEKPEDDSGFQHKERKEGRGKKDHSHNKEDKEKVLMHNDYEDSVQTLG